MIFSIIKSNMCSEFSQSVSNVSMSHVFIMSKAACFESAESFDTRFFAFLVLKFIFTIIQQFDFLV